MGTIQPGSAWIALLVGNSRLHWAWFESGRIHRTWHTPHLKTALDSDHGVQPWLEFWQQTSTQPLALEQLKSAATEIWAASVVPQQTQRLAATVKHVFALEQLSLKDAYPTLGIDRALALLGAGQQYGWPVLVMDGGTALTLTGGGPAHNLVGGAILPGLRLQLQSLGQGTAALPTLQEQQLERMNRLQRWATDTERAIASGVLHTLQAGLISFIEDWWWQFPSSPIVLTGGDGQLFAAWLQQRLKSPKQLHVEANLAFFGMQVSRHRQLQLASEWNTRKEERKQQWYNPNGS